MNVSINSLGNIFSAFDLMFHYSPFRSNANPKMDSQVPFHSNYIPFEALDFRTLSIKKNEIHPTLHHAFVLYSLKIISCQKDCCVANIIKTNIYYYVAALHIFSIIHCRSIQSFFGCSREVVIDFNVLLE